MEEIKELDDKYLVLKWRDITEGLNDENTKVFADLVQKVDAYRQLVRDKPVNKYVVLNLDDNIDIQKLIVDLEAIEANTPEPKIIQVNDIATVVVNAILCMKHIIRQPPG